MAETFKCPSCSAPLDFEGEPMQKCRFCGSNVIVPRSVLNESTAFGGIGSVDFSDLSALTGKALKIAEIQALLQRREKIQAIKLFRETFGTGLAEAKDAVDRMERGESIDLSGIKVQTAQVRVSGFSDPVQLRNAKKLGYSIGGSILGIVLVSFLVIGGIIAFVVFATLRSVDDALKQPISLRPAPSREGPASEIQPLTIAEELLRFGGQGNGAGKFTDNRAVAVDSDGRIYSGDRQGGRIQVFDQDGKFQTQLTANNASYVEKLLVDRKGTVIALQGYDVVRLNGESGDMLGKTRVNMATDAALGLDGKIYVATRFGPITVLNPDGTVLKTISPAKDLGIERVEKIAVDGAGNLFLLEPRSNVVFKLGPNATLLNRFSINESTAGVSRPNFTAHGLAVDSAGRLFVSQVSRVAIFDGNGTFLNDFKTEQAFGLAIDDDGNVFVASRPFVVKYRVGL